MRKKIKNKVFDEKLPIRMKCYWDEILTTKIRLYLVNEFFKRMKINLCSDLKVCREKLDWSGTLNDQDSTSNDLKRSGR